MWSGLYSHYYYLQLYYLMLPGPTSIWEESWSSLPYLLWQSYCKCTYEAMLGQTTKQKQSFTVQPGRCWLTCLDTDAKESAAKGVFFFYTVDITLVFFIYCMLQVYKLNEIFPILGVVLYGRYKMQTFTFELVCLRFIRQMNVLYIFCMKYKTVAQGQKKRWARLVFFCLTIKPS